MNGTYDAIYHYFIKNFNTNGLEPRDARCVIIGETEKSYRIKLIEATYNRLPDEVLWVRKISVERSYLNNKTKICDIYNLSPAEQSCRACIQRCWRRYDLQRKQSQG